MRYVLHPHPLILTATRRQKLFISIAVGFLISFFLLIFQPFGLVEIPLEWRIFHIFIYGFISAVILLGLIYIVPKILPRQIIDRKLTVPLELILQLLTVLIIGFCNFLYTVFFVKYFEISLKNILYFELLSLSVGLFPIVILLIDFYLRFPFKTQEIDPDHLFEETTIVTEKGSAFNSGGLPELLTLVAENGKDLIMLEPESLLFIKSEGNYVNIYYLRESSLTSKLMRNTLKNITAQTMRHPNIVRCHRTFMVNIDNIDSIERSNSAPTIKIRNSEELIPVSRTYVKNINKLKNVV